MMPVKQALSIFIRGVAMGSADVVPGVSGGTIAFITDIYDRLIASLRSADMTAIKLLFGLQFQLLWKHLDGGFLLALGLGIVTAIFSLAHVVDFLLDDYPVLIWSLFFGLIFASALSLLLENIQFKPQVKPQVKLWPLAYFVVGVALVLLMSTGSFASIEPSLPMVFMAGVIAISAMLLPGLSGSFLLLMLGLYEPTLEAVQSFDLPYILSFACGTLVGLLLFSRVIHYLLKNYYSNTLMLLVGMLWGSLYVVWPWRSLGVVATPVFPDQYSALGMDPMIVQALGCMFFGVGLVFLLGRIAAGFNSSDDKQ